MGIQVMEYRSFAEMRAAHLERKARLFQAKTPEPQPVAQPSPEPTPTTVEIFQQPDSTTGLIRVALTPAECEMIFALRTNMPNQIPTKRKRPTVIEVIEAVGILYDVSRIRTAQRTANVVRPRQIVMHLAKEHTGKSTVEIGRLLGGFDHSSVIHGANKIARLRSIDRQLGDELRWLEGQLAG